MKRDWSHIHKADGSCPEDEIRQLAKDPKEALKYAKTYVNKPRNNGFVEEVIKESAEKVPLAALHYAHNFSHKYFAKPIIKKAIEDAKKIPNNHIDPEGIDWEARLEREKKVPKDFFTTL